MPRLTLDQRLACERVGVDSSRLVALLRAYLSEKGQALEAEIGPTAAALLIGFRQGVEYERKLYDSGV